MPLPLCNIEVLESHRAGVVGGQFDVCKGQAFVGLYDYETECGTFTMCRLDGNWVCFDAGKVRVLQA